MKRKIAALAAAAALSLGALGTVAAPAGALNDIGGGGTTCRTYIVKWVWYRPVYICVRYW